jgi:hypothetical protein
MSIVEWAIIGFIIVSIGYHVWRGGAANPESTGQLGRRLGGLASKVGAIEGRVGHVEEKLAAIERDGATTKDIVNLEQLFDERMKTLAAQMEGHQQLSAATNRNVQRIVDLMLEKGLNGK